MSLASAAGRPNSPLGCSALVCARQELSSGARPGLALQPLPASSLLGDLSPPSLEMRLLEQLRRLSMVFPTLPSHEDRSQCGSGSSSAGRQVETTAFAKLNLRLIGRFDLLQ